MASTARTPLSVLQLMLWSSWLVTMVNPSAILPLKPAEPPTHYQKHNVSPRLEGVRVMGVEGEEDELELDGGTSRYASRMRPSPSDELPILPLDYPMDASTLPSAADLDTLKLKRLLGRNFDPEFMSTVRPLGPNSTVVYDFKDGHPRGKMPEELRQLSLSIPERKERIRIKSSRTRKRVRKFLWSYTHCPVLLTWKDLGKRFWPRWIREGDCYNSGRSCSIPAGMTCKPQESTTKTILWWHCRRKNCRWIKIQYPIISKCGCTC